MRPRSPPSDGQNRTPFQNRLKWRFKADIGPLLSGRRWRSHAACCAGSASGLTTQSDLSPAPVRTGVNFWRTSEQPCLHGNSAPLSALRAFVHRAAGLPAHVLVSGEAGTGKELVARCLHHQSGRRGPFVFVDCSVHHPSDLGIELFGPCRDAACAEMIQMGRCVKRDALSEERRCARSIPAVETCASSRK